MLTIAVCGISGHLHRFIRLLCDLEAQGAGLPVEILWLGDNKTRTTGRKRNELAALARGKYIVFVDDDDCVSPDYVKKILEAIDACKDADVIVFDVSVTGYVARGLDDKIARFDLGFDRDSNVGPFYQRLPNHIMVWRLSIVRVTPFPDKTIGEDSEWAIEAKKLARTQYRIEGPPLYHYDYGHSITIEEKIEGPDPTPAVHDFSENHDAVAVVLGSYQRRALLEPCIDSIRHAVGSLPYQIIVVDGGSTDGSRAWLAEQQDVALIAERGPLRGAVHSYDRGFGYLVDDRFRHAAIFNDDDLLLPGKEPSIQRAVETLNGDVSIGAVAFETDLRGGMTFETWYGIPYMNKGVVRTSVGKAVARAQGDPTGRDWWTRIHKHYASDTEFGLWIWRLGWTVAKGYGLQVHDCAPRDALRDKNDAEYTTSELFHRRWPASGIEYQRDEAIRFGGLVRHNADPKNDYLVCEICDQNLHTAKWDGSSNFAGVQPCQSHPNARPKIVTRTA